MIGGNAEAQALGIPKVLTALVSGAGSGVRITQAEINQMAHARGIQGDFEGMISKLSGKGALTPVQQQQLTGLLDDVKGRLVHKQGIASGALDSINGASKREDIVAADKAARQSLSALESGGTSASTSGGSTSGLSVSLADAGSRGQANVSGSQPTDAMVTVQIPGQKPGQIHASQKAAFLARYPNAKVN